MIILVDKPKGITSHDVVDAVRKISGERRVGHAGTLDPNATGLLVVGVGRDFTRKLGSISKNTKKTYNAEICLGEERDTDDVLGKIRNPKSEIQNNFQISKSKLNKTLKYFVGKQEQVPPEYSAVKVKGRKAYEIARRGKSLRLSARKIEIFSIKLISYEYPLLKISTEVSSGTYVRALARDLGRKLGCGAYLKNLRRMKIGKYNIGDAVQLKNLDSLNTR
jgi:tRNA pseudouridine55 synthase